MAHWCRRYVVPLALGILTLIPFVGLIGAILCRTWDAATTYATLLVGFIAADVVVWQGTLIKRQLAFSTYLELDKEWNSKEMIEARQAVHAPGSEECVNRRATLTHFGAFSASNPDPPIRSIIICCPYEYSDFLMGHDWTPIRVILAC